MKASATKVYRLLRDAGDEGVTTGQFLEAGVGRLSQRVAELRAAGHTIELERLASNRFRYRLAAPPSGATKGARAGAVERRLPSSGAAPLFPETVGRSEPRHDEEVAA